MAHRHPLLCLARARPPHAISGGKGRKSRTRQTRHRAAPAFRMAAQAVLRAAGALGAFYRRVTGRLGPAQALVATVHKMARTVSPMRKERGPYPDIGAMEDRKRCREREMHSLQKNAAKLGYQLSPA